MAHNRILSTIEKDFMINALDLGLRIDGRQLDTVREMKLEFGDKSGTVQVSLGKTRVLARVTHELGSPRLDKPGQGVITINCTFPKYLQDIISRDEIDRICQIIKSGIDESKAIDLESLCILRGTRVWLLTCNISIIQHDGNIIDCANLAVLSALKSHRRPDVTVVGSKITVHSMHDSHPVPLSIHHFPICVTLAHVNKQEESMNNDNNHHNQNKGKKKQGDDGFYTFNDPCLKEEKLMNGKTVYCMTRHKQLCAIDKIGGVPMSSRSFLQFINIYVMDIVKKWSNQIENKFMKYEYQKEDDLSRKKKIFKKEANPIDVFGFASLNEKIVTPTENLGEEENKDQDEDVDLLMVEDGLNELNNVHHEKIWNDWENIEKVRLETIRNNLNEKRIAHNKSVLTSEFE